MTVWFKALPLTASYLSQLPGFESWLEHVRKLAQDLKYGGSSLLSSTTYHWLTMTYGRKSYDNQKFLNSATTRTL